jgi:hypothetical protein
VAAIEPYDHDDVGDLEVAHARTHRRIQHEPRVRCPFVDGRLIATVKDEDGNVIGLLQDPA